MSRALDAAAFQALRSGAWGGDLRAFQALDSTQDEAARAAERGAGEGCVVLAERQEAGRGRWGRRWEGREGASLLFTVLIAGHTGAAAHPDDAATLPLVLGLASVLALRGLGLAEARCKWPNDVLWRGRKLGGILVEARGSWILAGCGINVAQGGEDFPPDLRATAASLAQAGLEAPREAVLAALLGRWERELGRWRREGFGALAGDWQACDALAGLDCRWTRAGRVQEGRALGLGPGGGLRLALADGSELLLRSGEVEQLRPTAQP